MGKLTDIAIRAIKPEGKARKFFDGGSLYLFVPPTGAKLWRIDYRFGGKNKLISLGAYPVVTLAEARQALLDVKRRLKAGIDPMAERKAVKEAARAEVTDSFEIVARECLAVKAGGRKESYTKDILEKLTKDIFPIIGSTPVGQVTAPQLLGALRRIEARGALETVRRCLIYCGQVFRYAIGTGRATSDASYGLREVLKTPSSRHLASITDPAGVGKLLRDIDAYPGEPIVRLALRLAPLVFVRPGELRKAEWAEFFLDGSEPAWHIPAERMKMKEKHIVPLARQAVEILTELRQYSGREKYLFPGFRTTARPISDMTLLNAIRNMGYSKEEMTAHGFRSMASTLLNEQGYNRDWIERQLAHSERNSIRAAYNYAEYLPERRRMMQEWADYLDNLRRQYQ